MQNFSAMDSKACRFSVEIPKSIGSTTHKFRRFLVLILCVTPYNSCSRPASVPGVRPPIHPGRDNPRQTNLTIAEKPIKTIAPRDQTKLMLASQAMTLSTSGPAAIQGANPSAKGKSLEDVIHGIEKMEQVRLALKATGTAETPSTQTAPLMLTTKVHSTTNEPLELGIDQSPQQNSVSDQAHAIDAGFTSTSGQAPRVPPKIRPKVCE